MASVAAPRTLVWAPEGHHKGSHLHPAYLLNSDGETAEIEWAANGTTANIPCCCISQLPPRRRMCSRQLQGGNKNGMLDHGNMNGIAAEKNDGKVHGIHLHQKMCREHKKHSKVQVIIKEDVKKEETDDEDEVHQYGNAQRDDVNITDHNKLDHKEKFYDSLERAPKDEETDEENEVQSGVLVATDHTKKGHRETVYDSLERATLPTNNREKVYDSLERAPLPSNNGCIRSKGPTKLTKNNQEYETKEQLIDEFIAQRCIPISKSQKIDEFIARRMAQSPSTTGDDTSACSPKKRKFTALIYNTPECNSATKSAVKLGRNQDCTSSSVAGIGAPSERRSRGVSITPGPVCSETTTLNNANVHSNNLTVSHTEKVHTSGALSERRCKAEGCTQYGQINCNGYCLTCSSRNGGTKASVAKGHMPLKRRCSAEGISVDQQNIAERIKSS